MKANLKSVESLKCSHCDKVFKYNSERVRHEISHSPHFECDVCFKKFSFVSALRRHQKQHERKGSVKCEECDRKFRDEVLLKRHIKYAHKGTFTCPKCSSTFSSDIALRTHMKTHKPVSERRFKCSHEGCGKSFNFSHHLKHHELTHSNVKQHFCAVCGKGFIQSHHLKTHLKTHNPCESLYCEFPDCKKKFSTEYAKKRHMAAHKNKPDSGISSDSNSWDSPVKFYEIQKKSVTPESNNTDIQNSNYLENSPKYLRTDDPNTKIEVLEDEKPKILPIVIEKVYTEVITAKASQNNDIDDCKIALGGCIAANNCICEKISKPATEIYDFVPVIKENSTYNKNLDFKEIDTEDYLVDKFKSAFKEIKMDINDNYEANEVNTREKYRTNACEGCECASFCTDIDKANCTKIPKNVDYNIPNIENRNGVIKLKNTFEIDFEIETRDKFVPFSTCKDIIGNCLVGGDGCLCARMTVDEQQAMAQEIEDITPQPKRRLNV